jgi:exonuclease III
MEFQPKTMKVISWNVAGRVAKYPKQLNAALKEDPDVIGLQEIIISTQTRWVSDLTKAGYYVKCSFDFVQDKSILKHGRKYGVITAARWELLPTNREEVLVPWNERFLSLKINSPWGSIEFHNIHMPAGVSQHVIKHQTFEGLFNYLAHKTNKLRILCGDFNSPRKEYPDGRVVVWGKAKREKDGRSLNDLSERQARAEHGIFTGLAEYNLRDVYRAVNGYQEEDYSWMHKWRDRITFRRFDHIFASSQLNPISCEYLHKFIDNGLSDHAAIVASFKPWLV